MGVLEHGPACHRHCMGAWAEPRPGDSGAAPGWGWRDNSSRGDVHDKRCLSHSRLGLTPGTRFVLGTLARGRVIRVQQKAFSQNFLLGGSSRDHQTQKPPEPVLLSCPKPVHSHLPRAGCTWDQLPLASSGYSQENCQESSHSSFPEALASRDSLPGIFEE